MIRPNSAKGQHSYDSTATGLAISFFNRNISEYPTEAGGVNFNLVPVTQQKDLMINHARMYAQQEYDRIIELVKVLEKQAAQIKRRLEVTDMVHAAEYHFQVVMGNVYYLVWDNKKSKTLLVLTGPDEWSTGIPENYEYITPVKYMGDHTWLEIDDKIKKD